MTPGVPLAEVTRRDVVGGAEPIESLHTGHLALVHEDGEVLGGLGAPDTVVFVRSTAKPFQVAACLELLALTGDRPSDPEIAVAWASHRAERRHIDAVRRLLARSGTDPEQLTCPPATGDADPGARPARLLHNCSGKHAMFALAASQVGCPRERLLDPDGPLQRPVLASLRETLGPAAAIGVDGCGAPAVAAPLAVLARGFATLAVAPRYAAVRAAGFAHPDLVGGDGRLESALLAAGVVAKIGAEGVFAAGWVGRDGTGRGLAVKVADGAARGATAATVAVLADLGVAPPGTWSPPPPLGGGVAQGQVRASGVVRELAAQVPTAR
jgi:L-asparaginase II